MIKKSLRFHADPWSKFGLFCRWSWKKIERENGGEDRFKYTNGRSQYTGTSKEWIDRDCRVWNFSTFSLVHKKFPCLLSFYGFLFVGTELYFNCLVFKVLVPFTCIFFLAKFLILPSIPWCIIDLCTLFICSVIPIITSL